MSSFSTFGESRRRRRQGAFWRLVRLAVAIGVLGAAVAYAYQVGLSQKAAEVARLETDVEELQEANRQLSARTAQALQQAERARLQAERLRERYERDVPGGELSELVALLEERLEDGVPADRLAFVIDAATRERDCDDRPTTRRFLVRTPISTGADSVVAFADNRITVTGEGQSSRDEEGQAQAWFDPGEPVRIRFAPLGSDIETASGLLPLEHAVVVDGREWRFSVTPGEERGFAQVTARSCAYP